MDWQPITALCGAFTVGGGLAGWFGRIVYRRGWQDKGAIAADLQAAASIVRLEASVEKLAGTVQHHERDLGRLEALVTTTSDGLKMAADEMRNLTQRIDQIFMPHRGERHG